LAQNKELEHLHEEKDGMINIIAHDLKSPLKQIQGLTDLIQMSGTISRDQEKYLGLVKDVVSHGSTLINNLLELHGIENVNNKQEFTQVNLVDFIPVWLQGYQSNLSAKKQKIKLDVQQAIGPIIINGDYLQRALDNLLTNAMKFSYDGSSIEISVSKAKAGLKLSVKDEGQGISEEEQKELFKPFKKLSARPTGGESSSGLGLSIVKLLVEKMDGTLEVSSKPGAGSTFTIYLPIEQA
jgi:signal transduction histidine kinase